jgi:hypothetical protein
MTFRTLVVIASLLALPAAGAADKAAPAAPAQVRGKVLEVRDADPYTYLRLGTRDGETWAAVPKSSVAKGTEVVIENPVLMKNFESKSLKKTFDKIVFGSLAGAGGVVTSPGDMASAHAGVSKAAAVGDVKVAKAEGPEGRTVAEVVAGKDRLKDKVVLVRGKVVKFTPLVMGRNWLHLQDGSGSASDSTHDVLVTTTDKAAIGDVVLAKGIVHTDKDLGSGYSYKVLIEDATLQK